MYTCSDEGLILETSALKLLQRPIYVTLVWFLLRVAATFSSVRLGVCHHPTACTGVFDSNYT